MQRRSMLKLSTLGAAALALRPVQASPAQPVLDAHIHLFDPARPGGVPWPEKSDAALYRPALPPRYLSLAQPFGVVGAIAVEASPLPADNDWLLSIAARSQAIVGIIGNLDPAAPDFPAQLDRLRANPLFLGIRYGNLWGRDLAADLTKPGFLEGLRALAQAGLVFESANPNPRLIRALVEIAEKVPTLRIVADHLPNAALPTDPAALRDWQSDLAHLAASPSVWVKISEIPVLKDGKLITSPAFYRDRINALWATFGDDKVLFGSDWPNSDHIASFADTFSLVRHCLHGKSPAALRKYLFLNSRTAYRWQPRTPAQQTSLPANSQS